MKYVLKARTNAYIIVQDNGDTVIMSDWTRATQFETAGDAMRAASKVNDMLGTNIIKIFRIE